MKSLHSTWMPFLAIALCLVSCKKENSRHCWRLIDNLGNDLSQVCNKTESELLACVNNHTCGINLGFTITSCNYYNDDGEKFCWLINGGYTENIPASKVDLYRSCFSSTLIAEKIPCGSCKYWFMREKRTYKPTNRISYSYIEKNLFCGDTLSSIFQGKQLIRKDDADSLIVVQFSNNGSDM